MPKVEEAYLEQSRDAILEALRNQRINEVVCWEWKDITTFWTNLIQEGQQRGQLNPAIDPAALAELLLAISLGLNVQKALGNPVDVDKCVQAWKALYSGDVHTRGLKVR